MSFQMPDYAQQVVYQADPQTTQSLKVVKDRMQDICRCYVNHYVRVETMDGHSFAGRIVYCRDGMLHLAVSHPGGHRPIFGFPQFGNPQFGNELILPLVLYELLVITLLYT